MTYVYPVISRRAGGVSIGINLNPNNACNWACGYCQVPNLQRGKGPVIDLKRLESELDFAIREIQMGEFMERHVPPDWRRLRDIAFSGNGEPTSSPQFEAAMHIVLASISKYSLPADLKIVVITNGSHTLLPAVQQGFQAMASVPGEIWFKIDRGRSKDIWAVNHVHLQPALQLKRLAASSRACTTWIQTCMTTRNGLPPHPDEVAGYLALLDIARKQTPPPRGVLLYTLARPSLQPDGPALGPVPIDWLQELSQNIIALGLETRVST